MIKYVGFVVVTALAAWWFLDNTFYSPKTRIKKLWDEVFKLTYDRRQIEEAMHGDWVDLSAFNKAIAKRKNLINALLDYHFDPEKDKEYIKGYRPEEQAVK